MRILVVDDEQCIRDFIQDAISYLFPETHVDLCDNVDEALVQYNQLQYDLIITDLLTGKSRCGTDLLKTIRSAGFTTPIVLCTGYTSKNCVDGKGFAAVLIKPFPLQELETTINRLMS